MISIILCGGVGQRLLAACRDVTPNPFMRSGGKRLPQAMVGLVLAGPGASRPALVTAVGDHNQVKRERTGSRSGVSRPLEPSSQHIASRLSVSAVIRRLAGNCRRADRCRQLVSPSGAGRGSRNA